MPTSYMNNVPLISHKLATHIYNVLLVAHHEVIEHSRLVQVRESHHVVHDHAVVLLGEAAARRHRHLNALSADGVRRAGMRGARTKSGEDKTYWSRSIIDTLYGSVYSTLSITLCL